VQEHSWLLPSLDSSVNDFAHVIGKDDAAALDASLRTLSRDTEERGNANSGLLVHYAEAGQLDAAFELLERAIDVRDPALVHLAVAPGWDSLRADPRFNQCLARMKLRPVTLPKDGDFRGAL
jgi:hypothetical protein